MEKEEKEEKLTGRLDGRPCMLSSWLLLLEAMGWLDGGAVDCELKESWESSYFKRGTRRRKQKGLNRNIPTEHPVAEQKHCEKLKIYHCRLHKVGSHFH